MAAAATTTTTTTTTVYAYGLHILAGIASR
jgi:hypothetical protein